MTAIPSQVELGLDTNIMPELNRTKLKFKLNTGDRIPAIGIGTWHVKGNAAAEEVKMALQAGYRHVDTAFAYGNEREVGEGIKASGVPRKDIWLTTKHWPCATDPEDTSKPLPEWDFIKTWEVMQELPDTGKVKNIGICNFQLVNLDKLLSHPSCKVVPAVNQIELHRNHPSTKLVEVCRSKGIHVTAYSCLGSEKSPLLSGQDKVLNQIAKTKGKTPAQILLSWGIQRGTSVLPRSTKPDRIKSNFALDNWELNEDEMEKLNSVKDRFKACGDGFLPIRVFFDDDE